MVSRYRITAIYSLMNIFAWSLRHNAFFLGSNEIMVPSCSYNFCFSWISSSGISRLHLSLKKTVNADCNPFCKGFVELYMALSSDQWGDHRWEFQWFIATKWDASLCALNHSKPHYGMHSFKLHSSTWFILLELV